MRAFDFRAFVIILNLYCLHCVMSRNDLKPQLETTHDFESGSRALGHSEGRLDFREWARHVQPGPSTVR